MTTFWKRVSSGRPIVPTHPSGSFKTTPSSLSAKNHQSVRLNVLCLILSNLEYVTFIVLLFFRNFSKDSKGQASPSNRWCQKCTPRVHDQFMTSERWQVKNLSRPIIWKDRENAIPSASIEVVINERWIEKVKLSVPPNISLYAHVGSLKCV